jgi:uncharacterized protein
VNILLADLKKIELQLGRPPRDLVEVAFRGSCGNPAVVKTKPRLADGTPFPTLFYLTCPRLNSRLGTLESVGFMKELEVLLNNDEKLKDNYQKAHQNYISERESFERVEEISEVSAGGMPTRVKCLHSLAAHSLAKGKGENLIGDLVLEKIGEWCQSACIEDEDIS